jgi:hypothetical protein
MVTESWQVDVRRRLADAGIIAEWADGAADTMVRIVSPPIPEPYLVQFTPRVALGTVPSMDPSVRNRLLIAAPHVPDSLGELWRTQGVQYVDAVGNMYVRGPGLLLDVRGRRPQSRHTHPAGDKPLRAFRPSGIRVLFVLLSFPEAINETYRRIAQASGVSLGTVQWVMDELADNGYLRVGSATKQLYRVRELFNRWTDAYVLNLHPRLTLARFEAPDPRWWVDASQFLRAEDAQWGGETAAFFLNPRLRPATTILYAQTVPHQLALRYRFREAKNTGNVEVRQRFWRHLDPQRRDTVPSPLIYADMIASADPRQLEAADHLRTHDESIGRLDQS